MKKLLLFLTAIILTNVSCIAQFGSGVWDGIPNDSNTFTLEVGDSLSHTQGQERIDTTGATLWRIGSTSKTFFASSPAVVKAIMTDTTNPYPANANDWFVLKLNSGWENIIVDFQHKFQTANQHAGGIVEFSYDNGLNWTNVIDSCNTAVDHTLFFGVQTDNFYSMTDTLLNGERAFTGASSSWKYSRVQFFNFLAIKYTGSSSCTPPPTMLLRFRFVSDTMSSSFDGWIIDNIKIEHDRYPGNVSSLNSEKTLGIYPNPSYSGIINFPKLENEKNYSIEIINAQGRKIMNIPYKHSLDLSTQPAGLYFYKVTNGEDYYSGSVLLEH